MGMILCEDRRDFMKRFPDKFFDLVVDDPPYFKGVGKMGYMGKKQSKIGVKRGAYDIPNWDENVPDQQYLDELLRISKHQIIWGINYYDFIHSPGRIIWDKVNGNSPFSDCEIASCSFHYTVRMFSYMWNGMYQGRSMSDGRIQQGNKSLNEPRIHPTQKPIILYDWIYKTYLPEGGKVGDFHLGSGSNRISADKSGNIDFYSCESDPKMFKAQDQRFKSYKQQLKLF